MITVFQKALSDAKLKTLEQFKIGSWIAVENPTEEELTLIAKERKLDEKQLSDALDPYESPRVETENGTVYIFTRTPIHEETGTCTTPLLIVVGENFVMTLSKTEHIASFTRLCNGNIQFATTQKTRLVLTLLSEIIHTYQLFLTGINRTVRSQSTNIETIDNRAVLNFVASEEVLNDFLAALVPMNASLQRLLSGRSLKLYKEDADITEDLVLDTAQLIELSKSTLKSIVNIREAYSTILTNNLNRIIKLLTSLTVILAIPTVIASIYGMNVTLPFGDTHGAFAGILAFIIISTVALLVIFGKKKWL